MGRGLLAICVALTGCLQADVTVCADGTICPAGTACDEVHDACVLPDQLVACDDLVDGDACDIAGGLAGICDQGVCTQERCGDGYARGDEECDEADLGDLPDCTQHGFYDAAPVACTDACTYDTSACTGACGDLARNGSELCDGADLGTADCTTLGYYDAPGLACSPSCTYDVAGCTGFCGDELVNGVEACDGGPMATCVERGYDTGTIACGGGCDDVLDDCEMLGWELVVADAGPSLNGIWAGDRAVFAVGNQGAILRSTGGIWVPMFSGTSQNLTAVWGSAPDDVFVAGASSVLHYDGASWSSMPGSSPTIDLWGSAPDNVWAISGSAIFRYDGATWSSVPLPPWFDNTPAFEAIWTSGPTDVWVVGETQIEATTTDEYAWHFDGTTWTMAVAIDSQATDVWGSGPGDVYATVGGGVMHFDGASWSDVTSAQGGALGGAGPNDAFVLGGAGYAAHLDGVAATRIPNGPAGTFSDISVRDGDDLWAVAGSSIVRFRGTIWEPVDSGVLNVLYGVWGALPTWGIHAVGYNGTIRRSYDGVTWSAVTSNTTQILYDVWGDGSTQVLAVGAGGVIRRSTGGNFTAVTSGTTQTLRGVWGSSSSDVFVVGDGGTILHGNGSSFTAMTSNTTAALLHVAGTGPSEVYAVGSDGVHHYDGSTWSLLPGSPDGPAMWVAGVNDVIVPPYRFDGTTWRGLPPAPDTGAFFGEALAGTSASDVFATAYYGGPLAPYVQHFDGERWSVLRGAPSGIDLYDAWSNGVHTYFVGAVGTIVRLVRTPVNGVGPEHACLDHYDDDRDGLTDGCDPDCAGAVVEQCANQRDDDCDGATDCADDDCDALLACVSGGACRFAEDVACGAQMSGTTVTGQAAIDLHGCSPRLEDGPEVSYRLVPTTSGAVTVTISGFGLADLDLVVAGAGHDDACDPWSVCVGASSAPVVTTETVTFDATAGETYYVIVDGASGDAGSFTLDVACP